MENSIIVFVFAIIDFMMYDWLGTVGEVSILTTVENASREVLVTGVVKYKEYVSKSADKNFAHNFQVTILLHWK